MPSNNSKNAGSAGRSPGNDAGTKGTGSAGRTPGGDAGTKGTGSAGKSAAPTKSGSNRTKNAR
ncbi:hypothetical protein [Tahibacter amnicola]|uniref:Uncharacterized protein n=1 Tax=Tahibacter amnicola TaxID=2976241 RepID=A0ABY6BJ99_9GAMM|nr:hypothetical protein [Tahibacter amnicola]UXI70086.1 hypothetical protein N4264_10795 [Tahibacter amnicola]